MKIDDWEIITGEITLSGSVYPIVSFFHCGSAIVLSPFKKQLSVCCKECHKKVSQEILTLVRLEAIDA